MTSPAAPVALFGSTGGVGPSGRPAPKTGGSGAHGLSAETALAVRPRPVASFVQISPLRTAQPPRRLTRHPPTDHSPRRLLRTTLPRARISAATPRRAWTRRHSLPSARWRRRSRPTRGCTPSPAAPSDDDDDDRPMTTSRARRTLHLASHCHHNRRDVTVETNRHSRETLIARAFAETATVSSSSSARAPRSNPSPSPATSHVPEHPPPDPNRRFHSRRYPHRGRPRVHPARRHLPSSASSSTTAFARRVDPPRDPPTARRVDPPRDPPTARLLRGGTASPRAPARADAPPPPPRPPPRRRRGYDEDYSIETVDERFRARELVRAPPTRQNRKGRRRGCRPGRRRSRVRRARFVGRRLGRAPRPGSKTGRAARARGASRNLRPRGLRPRNLRPRGLRPRDL